MNFNVSADAGASAATQVSAGDAGAVISAATAIGATASNTVVVFTIMSFLDGQKRGGYVR
ncbi:hypothetical protein [Paractinoplanes toevensis]|uniref:hypothetical protein n=1 Tax=Paractinoplanes toevensis TaxID=571911 RepID=UPI001BB35307|nr:hypothetical protein [Actinoplanes toevensis]